MEKPIMTELLVLKVSPNTRTLNWKDSKKFPSGYSIQEALFSILML